MNEDTVSNTLASIYNISDFHVGSLNLDLLLGYFSGPAAIVTFNSLKMLGGLISVILLLMFIINFVRMDRFIRTRASLLKTLVPPQSAQSSPLGSRWDEIQKHLNSTKEAEWKFAVIEADSLVDYILKSSGYPGDTMGDRLKNIDKTQIVTLDGLWEAHKIRNRLAHDVSYFLRYGEAKRAVQLYEKTLKELNAL
ncbi:MAG: hypothetical protein A2655_03190 [Candidatus Yanofskybacteria bacterium RIFCSPHIGHO2_01_FULL_43_42]|uniref:Uncharacterized protein n=1 Tax=Candidatus Yanofskybacteria bacterium RIFCSPLOWO2_01_FULL_43_22 TaxID=1802695 RepID=A0A1F8GEV9_9BACT|nr:MAG: hypothetical protein A2655_03190 [Candidatus Yanofskybacteria bacterium RIFCSPHIGHO2_01_FULL_43_42]OGN13002.1 MAG: hypothetical protein A3D48_03850 [Candidatus Yanofskybacteria bacterium RIFCSPHIGHO2_02_FULL_43_17]OGN23917.1 MAG: hypothetical protein A3A13_02405 [Candidatus Yanofskybacteria bacterium RIFCSPLOWO2_01_FULL_43_22]